MLGSRRATLVGLSAVVTMLQMKLAMADGPTDQRFVVVLLRGAEWNVGYRVAMPIRRR